MSGMPRTPEASSEHARRTMIANRRKDTSIERTVRSKLFASGARYRVDFAPDPANKRRRADIVFTKARVAVFLDGCFWHGCSEHFVLPKTNVEYWSAKIARNRARDLNTTERLVELGWRVRRYWEHQDPDDVVADLLAVLR